MKKKGEVYEIGGHLCKGLKKHLEFAYYGCIPAINENGTIGGCDDTNLIQIKFCPFCGVKLELEELDSYDKKKIEEWEAEDE